MAEARRREEWDHTAALSSLIATLATGKLQRAALFNPLAACNRPGHGGLTISDLKVIFNKKGKL